MPSGALALEKPLECTHNEDNLDPGAHVVPVGVRSVEEYDRLYVAPVVGLANTHQRP